MTGLDDTDLSTWIRTENKAIWEAMQTHRFVTDIEKEQLPREVLCRYFFFEHAFVETAVQIFAYALLKAPGFAQRRRLIATLSALSEAQLVWFQDCFASLGIGQTGEALPPAVTAFAEGMLAIARDGDYADIVAIMLAAEWMYGTWCVRAHRRPSAEPMLRSWVQLHAEPEFLDGADWLRAEVNREAARLNDAQRARLATLFGRALQLEIDFHEAAYDSTWPVPKAEGNA
ncbi:TenA family protein [Acidisoma cellulosilytica]|uniref:Aminopyrimidine aminohydrolase n=1 Tax=Acidisoma cellulosilyticum TaxID=2802395 RepID=A0A964E6A8_9PROT|nr:TenA family protein [Acidisoma cellulosilyticum]MCB8883515.1 TenA family protein [Acidisoma cellulosilyticum]